mgnify:CR=1 FL=1
MSNARYFIHNPFMLPGSEVTHAMDVEVRDCECNRIEMTLLLSDPDTSLDDLDKVMEWSIRAWSDSYPFTWEYSKCT